MKTAIITLMSLVLALVILAPTASANTIFYENNNILYYNPEDTQRCVPGSSGYRSRTSVSISGANLPPQTRAKLVTMSVKTKVAQNKSSYLLAEQQTGVPWVMLAALHFREGGLDRTKSIADGEPITGKSYLSMDGAPIGANLDDDAVFAARHFINMAKMVYEIDVTKADLSTAEIGRAFLAYNRGFLYKSRGLDYTSSGYVMQGIDARHIGGPWIFLDPFGGHKKAKYLTNGNPGALAVIAYLTSDKWGNDTSDATTMMPIIDECTVTNDSRGDSSTDDGNSAIQGNIVATAKNLAWPHRVQIRRSTAPRHGASAAKSIYVAEVNKFTKHFHDAEYTDCGIFIATIMRSSGVDPKYPARGTSIQLNYVRNSPLYKTFVAKSESELRPGDILIRPGHTYMYVGEYTAPADGKKYKAVGASWHTRPPSGHSLYLSGNSSDDISSSSPFTVARFIGGSS